MTATDTAQTFKPGDTVRVTASYNGVSIGAQGVVRGTGEGSDEGMALIDLPVRGRMRYPADSLALVSAGLEPEQKSQVEHLVSKHVERLRRQQGEPAQIESLAGLQVTRSATADRAAARDMEPVKAAWDAETQAAKPSSLEQALNAEREIQKMTPEEFAEYRKDPNGLGHDPTSMAERRADDTEFARILDLGKAAVSEIQAPESDETPKEAPEDVGRDLRPLTAHERGQRISEGKRRAKEQRMAQQSQTAPPAIRANTTSALAALGVQADNASRAFAAIAEALRDALLVLAQDPEATPDDLVVTATLIKRHHEGQL